MNEENSKFTFLYMKQVPKKTASDFVSLANEEFAGHFGFALKGLLDANLGFKSEIDASRLEDIERRMIAVEQLISGLRRKEDEKPARKNMLGEEIGAKKTPENGG